tara:strand:- start:603 stop:857 length:255 start_codon:yes stop_codon:yes gene_type:complete
LKIRTGKNTRRQDRPRSTGYEVHIPNGDDPMKHYKRLKKRMTKDGFFQELKDRRYFISNVERRREREKREKRMISKERSKQSLL